jgi:hypothetical protein
MPPLKLPINHLDTLYMTRIIIILRCYYIYIIHWRRELCRSMVVSGECRLIQITRKRRTAHLLGSPLLYSAKGTSLSGNFLYNANSIAPYNPASRSKCANTSSGGYGTNCSTRCRMYGRMSSFPAAIPPPNTTISGSQLMITLVK